MVQNKSGFHSKLIFFFIYSKSQKTQIDNIFKIFKFLERTPDCMTQYVNATALLQNINNS